MTVVTVARVGSFSFSLLFTFVPGNLRLFDLIDSSMAILTCTNLVFQNIRDAVHIQIVTNNVIFTLLVGGWVGKPTRYLWQYDFVSFLIYLIMPRHGQTFTLTGMDGWVRKIT